MRSGAACVSVSLSKGAGRHAAELVYGSRGPCHTPPCLLAATAIVLTPTAACLQPTVLAVDPILGITEAFLKDKTPNKINLGVVGTRCMEYIGR